MRWFGLLCEQEKDVSIGRVFLLITFVYMTWFWFISESPIPPTLMSTFEWILGYNFGKKIIDTIKANIVLKG